MQMQSLCGVTTKLAGGLGTAAIAADEEGVCGLGLLNVLNGAINFIDFSKKFHLIVFLELFSKLILL